MKLLGDLPRNARYSIMVEPMWAIFGGMVLFYAPLYMKQLGLSEIEMGIVNTLNMLMACICHFLAGPVTNKYGRKKTTLIFDVISWSIPMLVWAAAQNFWFFITAGIINAFVKIVSVSWYCMITEDTPENKRSRVFAIIYIINYATGLVTPITGLLFARFGIVPAMRILYGLGAVSMTTMFFLRNSLVTETRAGLVNMEKHSRLSAAEIMKSYFRTIANAARNHTIILLAFIYIITNFIISLNFFQVVFMKEQLGFNETYLSVIPGVSAIINLLLFVIVIPRVTRISEEKKLSFALAVSAAGALLFLLVPRGNFIFLYMTTSILAVGNFIMQTYRDAVFMNKVGEDEKADAFAAVQTLTTLVSIPSGAVAGFAYSFNPRLPFIFIFILFVISLAVSLMLNRQETQLSRNIKGRLEN